MANFDRIAIFYDRLKRLVFGSQIDKASRHFLHKIPDNCSILIIGGGSGTFLSDFKSNHLVKYVELSSVMIDQAKKVEKQASVEFVEADILNWTSTEEFDYVLSPFILDCFNDNQLSSIVEKYRNLLKKDGKWIQTDFYPKAKWQNFLISVMYVFFNLSVQLQTSKLADFDLIFEKFGFKCERKASFFHSMIESRIYKQIE